MCGWSLGLCKASLYTQILVDFLQCIMGIYSIWPPIYIRQIRNQYSTNFFTLLIRHCTSILLAVSWDESPRKKRKNIIILGFPTNEHYIWQYLIRLSSFARADIYRSVIMFQYNIISSQIYSEYFLIFLLKLFKEFLLLLWEFNFFRVMEE